jgi:aromatic ring-opening dioxygenase catalytic subunit (LigB family)
MTEHRDENLSRRQALLAVTATAAAIATGAGASEATAQRARSEHEGARVARRPGRMPVVYLPHGGGPWPFVDVGIGDRRELDAMATYLRSVAAVPETPPRALLVISAHWEEAAPTVMTSARPPMLYDYYGFPPASYEIQWPAPGDPALAARVRALLSAAGIASAEDASRGFDHGTFVPLKLAFPDAAVPTVQLSLVRGLDPRAHLAIGRALAPLRDEGVLIVGSGMSYHNLRMFGPRAAPISEAFDAWLREAVRQPGAERDARLAAWANAPSARQAHPREEHLIPLMVVAGAAGADHADLAFDGTLMGLRLSAFHFG